jgi:hypothetical protein
MPAIQAGMTEISIFILRRRAQEHESLCGQYSFTPNLEKPFFISLGVPLGLAQDMLGIFARDCS